MEGQKNPREGGLGPEQGTLATLPTHPGEFGEMEIELLGPEITSNTGRPEERGREGRECSCRYLQVQARASLTSMDPLHILWFWGVQRRRRKSC